VNAINHSIPVECLLDRSWNPRTRSWVGRTASGTLIDFTAQSAQDNADKLITVGIVMLESGAFESVPTEFITKA